MNADEPRPWLMHASEWAPHAWLRWMRQWRWFALSAVVLAVAVNMFDAPAMWPPPFSVLALVTALVAWYGVWDRTLRLASASIRRWALPLLAAAAIGMSISLTHLSMSFWLLGLVFIPLFFVVLPLGWSVAAAIALTAHAGWESRFGGGTTTLSPIELFAFLLSRALLATLIGIFLRYMVQLADRRERLSVELASTRDALARASHTAGVMAERQRMARELHDTLTQGLSAVVMHLETAEQLLPTEALGSRTHMHRARAIARESLDDTRRVVASLRPELLEHVELPEAVSRLCAQATERNGVVVSVVVTGTPVPLHPEVEITLFRALQEGLSNVRKHAHAHAVSVTLSYMDDQVMLDVRDDGDGFDVPVLGSALTGGFGLRAMRERAEQLHGTASIESERGEGTTLTVSIPLLHTAELPILRTERT